MVFRAKNKTVRVRGLRPEVLFGLLVVKSVLSEHGYDTVITSGVDSKHGYGSLHYSGGAVDIRSKHIPTIVEKHQILREFQENLPADFDIVLEYLGTSNEHYHMEYQPKGV